MNDGPIIKACVFDAYGTLFDVHSAVGRYRSELGERSDQISGMWRVKQLEYTWLRSLMGRYEDFSQVTADALDYSLATFDVENPALREKLLLAYQSLDCYPEVPAVLRTLVDGGMRLAILSNGSPGMLDAAVRGSRLQELFDSVISVDELKIFKPDPRVYQLACDRLGVEPDAVMFQSSNAWDAAGAKSFGFNVAWINRFSQQPERLGFPPDNELDDLSQLPVLVGAK